MRLAFVIGSNGPDELSPLKYACTDAQLMKASLENPRCGFKVVSPQTEEDPFEIRRQLYKTVESCTSEDSFIFYFSGHGILHKGSLFLLWNNTDLERLGSTAIAIADILQAFKFCKAHSTLLILDCCHAGAAVQMAGLKKAVGEPVEELVQPSNHLVLMASDRLEKTREIENLKGGFLTVNICSALTDNFHKADKDGDGRLSIKELMKWLQRKTLEHNRKFPDKTVPYPYTFGQERGEFHLTSESSLWTPYEIPWIDGSAMVVLPIPYGDWAICLSKHPVTNAQYRKFVDSARAEEPIGKNYEKDETETERGEWIGPFYPWGSLLFKDPYQPVVCVSFKDALAYCKWVNAVEKGALPKKKNLASEKVVDRWTTLPPSWVWDLAAFGVDYPIRDSSIWLNSCAQIHHNDTSPALIDTEGNRVNAKGISDLFGNIWEWCYEDDSQYLPRNPKSSFLNRRLNLLEDKSIAKLGALHNREIVLPFIAITNHSQPSFQELRGGSFLDDLFRITPFLTSSKLTEGTQTHHSDLGFRIAGAVLVDSLPEEIRAQLSLCKPISTFMESIMGLVVERKLFDR